MLPLQKPPLRPEPNGPMLPEQSYDLYQSCHHWTKKRENHLPVWKRQIHFQSQAIQIIFTLATASSYWRGQSESWIGYTFKLNFVRKATQNFILKKRIFTKNCFLIFSLGMKTKLLSAKTYLYYRDIILSFKYFTGCASKYSTSQFINCKVNWTNVLFLMVNG